jgi:hypothetical protein
MNVWVLALPTHLQDDATSALMNLITVAKAEIEDAYGDGFRLCRDEERVQKKA